MTARLLTLVLSTITFLSLSACGGGGGGGSSTPSPSTTPDTEYPVTTNLTGLTSIRIDPARGIVKVGDSIQLHALGNYQDGSTKDITSAVNWIHAGDVTMGARGLFTGTAAGGAAVTATGNELAGVASIVVSTYGTEGTVEQPKLITVGTTHRGEVNVGGDNAPPYSYYHFATNPGETYYVRLNNMTANADVQVFDDAGFTNALCQSSASGTTAENCAATAPENGGDLYVRVDGSNVNFTDDNGAAFDIDIIRGYGDEGPIDVPLNTEVSGQVGRGSSEYTVALQYSGKYTVSVSGFTESVDLMALTPTSVVICQDYDEGLGTVSCAFQAEVTEARILVTSDYQTADIGTAFKLTITEDHGPYSDEGSVDTPIGVTPGVDRTGQVGGAASYYSAAVTAGKSYTVTLSGLVDPATLMVYDGDPNYTAYGYDCRQSTASLAEITCRMEPVASDMLYIEVTGNEFGADYTLTVSEIVYQNQGLLSGPLTLDPVPSVYTSPYEGEVGSGVSYYKVAVEAGAKYHANLTGLSGDVALSVYDDAGFTTLLCGSNNADLADESCETASEASTGTLYIMVTGSVYGSKFGLTVDRVYQVQGSFDAPWDMTASYPTFAGETGSSSDTTQQSHYTVTLEAGKTYRFTVSDYTHDDVAMLVHDGAPSYEYATPTCLAADYSGNYSCVIEPLTSGWVTIIMRAVNTEYGAGFTVNIEEVTYQSEGTDVPVDIGSYPVADFLYEERTSNQKLEYNGQAGAGSSYYVAHLTEAPDYVGFRVALTGQSTDANLYVYEDAAYSIELCSSLNGSVDDESCAFSTPSDTVYIRVDGSPSGFGALYTVVVDSDYNGEGAPLVKSGGTYIGGAVPVALGAAHQGEAGDADSYYAVPVTLGVTYNVNLTDLFNAACVYVYPNNDGSFEPLYSYTEYTSDLWLRDKVIPVTAQSDTLHIRISGCGAYVDGSAYTLSVTPVTPAP